MLEFISEPDLTFLIEALAGGGRYLGQVMGPARLRFVDGRGVEKWTEYWAFGCPPEFGFEGYVVTMTIESVSDNVAQAIRQIASGEPIESSMASIARAVSAYPISAAGTIVLGAEARTVIGT